MNKYCAGCGKPVYFAERKTSLGREWHPSCLKCKECGKVLSPGQHAEHKGMPYCHHPCYRALFGPAILGYGSNISSPANFAPRKETAIAAALTNNRASTGSILDSVLSEDTMSYTYSLSRRNRPKHHLVHQNSNGVKRDIDLNLSARQQNSGSGEVESRSGGNIQTHRSFSQEPLSLTALAVSPLHSLAQPPLSSPPSSSKATAAAEVIEAPEKKDVSSKELQEMLEKLADFNTYYEGKIHNQMRAEQRDDGSVFVEGPLRIYWGLSRPIQLAHCDNIPPAPISQWRHSLHINAESPVDSPHKSFATMSLRRTGSPARKSRDLDDLLSPTSTDDVVRRKKGGVRKFKTVAYRGGDQPSKWKRASINGHIFNFDTSVFTPVLGSCTSVTVDGTLSSLEVIRTLLDKFKVQNSADEYVLSIVNEEGERLLTNRDCPLLERLKLGPDETVGKIFIKEREVLQEEGVGELVVSANVKTALSTGDSGGGDVAESDGAIGISRGLRSSSIKMPIRETEEEENLPQEVEQLLVLPDAVLRGLLDKFHKDEEKDVRKIRARYEVVKQRMSKRLYEILSNSTSSTA